MTMESICGDCQAPPLTTRSRRREQARRTREAIVAAARRRFLDDGYAATTIGSIAADADASVDTIYKTFGGKAGLLRVMCEQALEGAGPDARRATIRRDAGVRDRPGDDAAWPRDADDRGRTPHRAAAPAAGHGRRDRRRDRPTAGRTRRRPARPDDDGGGALAAKGPLRAGLSIEDAAEIMWTYSSPELYGLLVGDRHWSPERYGEFVGQSLVDALLGPESASHTSP